MKILILTQYYPPETGAPQNRLHSLSVNLVKQGCKVEVLTALPNYPKQEIFEDYKNKKHVLEHIDGIPVHRAGIYVSKSKKVFDRLLNYFSFVYSSIKKGSKLPEYDYILCESPPLFLGISALYLKWKLNAKLIFNVSDLWPESAEKLNIVNNKFLLKLAYVLESYIYEKSFLVTGQTQGIVKSINERFPKVKTLWFPNGIDKNVYEIEEDTEWIKKYDLQNKNVYVYAGIIGIAQGLEVIINAKRQIDISHKEVSDNIKIVLIGDGPDKERLLEMDKNLNTNITFIKNTPKAQVLKMLKTCYAFIVPLKKLDLFLGAIPSKIFDALGLQKPILLGVDGEAKTLFIDQGNCGLFFEPENVDDLVKSILLLESNQTLSNKLGENGKDFAFKYFDRTEISKKLLNKIEQLNHAN